MKTAVHFASARRQSQSGMVAVVVVMIILGLLLALSVANVATLRWLHQEVKLVEQHQTQTAGTAAAANTPTSVSQ